MMVRAFYTAENRSKEPIIGVATYSVTPGQVAGYFNKIQVNISRKGLSKNMLTCALHSASALVCITSSCRSASVLCIQG